MNNLSTSQKVVTAVSLLMALFFLYQRRGNSNASNVAVLTDFSTVDGRIFSEKERDQEPILEFESLRDTFVVHEDPQESHKILRHSLHARLSGPNGQQFGCFLFRSEDNTHHCPTAAGLELGEWNVNITLVRSPVKEQLRQCRPGKTALYKKSNAGSSKSSTTFSIIDYILAGDFPTFEAFLNCFQYPYAPVLQAKWIKTQGPDTNDNYRTQEICQGPGGPGTWIDHSEPCSTTNICQGAVDDEIFNHISNIERGIQHIFKPFSCRPQLFDTTDARTCALDNSITLAGDSRTLHLVTGFQRWLGKDAVQFIPLYKPYRLGLTHAWSQPSGAQLRKAIRSGKAILINSVLHDVAEFFSTTTAEDVMKAWSKYVDCSSEECSGKLALQCGCRKQWAVKAYLSSIDTLRDDIIAARKEALKDKNAPEPRVFWVSLNKRPPSPPDVFYDWQTADVVRELEDRASMELGKAGVEHIDLRWMTGAAPGRWWDDPVHFGKNKKSMFLHSTLHAILSQVCR
ncbi:hypothetical protein Ndes2526B_g01482 [Nannochloris sp. 'desiccata']|nr:hypothetical protein NADE_009034 [Chlorella desiccata (nom. nud.)]